MNRFEPRTDILPKAQQELWPLLAPAPGLSFVLYGGTAVALYLGHRVSVDFDFFRSARLDKKELDASFAFIKGAKTILEDLWRRRWERSPRCMARTQGCLCERSAFSKMETCRRYPRTIRRGFAPPGITFLTFRI